MSRLFANKTKIPLPYPPIKANKTGVLLAGDNYDYVSGRIPPTATGFSGSIVLLFKQSLRGIPTSRNA
jgi:hypothetical protein